MKQEDYEKAVRDFTSFLGKHISVSEDGDIILYACGCQTCLDADDEIWEKKQLNIITCEAHRGLFKICTFIKKAFYIADAKDPADLGTECFRIYSQPHLGVEFNYLEYFDEDSQLWRYPLLEGWVNRLKTKSFPFVGKMSDIKADHIPPAMPPKYDASEIAKSLGKELAMSFDKSMMHDVEVIEANIKDTKKLPCDSLNYVSRKKEAKHYAPAKFSKGRLFSRKIGR